MTTCKIILTPTTKEPKICHALATTSAFNLKLCFIILIILIRTIRFIILIKPIGLFRLASLIRLIRPIILI